MPLKTNFKSRRQIIRSSQEKNTTDRKHGNYQQPSRKQRFTLSSLLSTTTAPSSSTKLKQKFWKLFPWKPMASIQSSFCLSDDGLWLKTRQHWCSSPYIPSCQSWPLAQTQALFSLWTDDSTQRNQTQPLEVHYNNTPRGRMSRIKCHGVKMSSFRVTNGDMTFCPSTIHRLISTDSQQW